VSTEALDSEPGNPPNDAARLFLIPAIIGSAASPRYNGRWRTESSAYLGIDLRMCKESIDDGRAKYLVKAPQIVSSMTGRVLRKAPSQMRTSQRGG